MEPRNKPKVAAFRPNSSKFEGDTTHHRDFKAYGVCPVVQMPPLPSKDSQPTAFWDRTHQNMGGNHVFYNVAEGHYE